jgi:endonuclease/exonuclease/phosphatase (EEP) superfamily protein YafD
MPHSAPLETAHAASGNPQQAPVAPRRRARLVLAVLVVAYAATIVALTIWLHAAADRSWLATILLFGPRWLCALPLLVLVPLAAWLWPRLLVVLAATGLVILVPLLGFRLHLSSAGQPARLRVMTCNVNRFNYSGQAMRSLIATERPDLVALQEVVGRPPAIWPRGWHVVQNDEYVVASRFPVVEREHTYRLVHPGKIAALRYTIDTPDGEVQLFNLHLPTPREGLEAVLDRRKLIDSKKIPQLEASLEMRRRDSQKVSDWIASFPGPKIVVGDFNTPVESALFRRYWLGLSNAFSTAGFGFGFTKITEKHGWSYGARIDHVLYSPPWNCTRAWVAGDVGSDHLPLLANFD